MNYAIDIGSTLVKVVDMTASHGASAEGRVFYPRDHDAGIAAQVGAIINGIRERDGDARFRICSSANGGLRVGILCLTTRFSGRVAANLASAAGANVIFVQAVSSDSAAPPDDVDVLVVVGGIDCPETGRLKAVFKTLDLSAYRYQSLVYAGNSDVAAAFGERHPNAKIVANPLGHDLAVESDELYYALRDAYLDDLIDKDGVTALQASSDVPVRPTPAVVNAAFRSISGRRTRLAFPTPFILIDIGGATTDVHYGIELLRDDGDARLEGYPDDNRYVFTDLGDSASRASTGERLADHPGLHDFLAAFDESRLRDLYRAIREGHVPDEVLVYACYFLALDAIATGRRDGIPPVRIERANAIVVTGGASQVADGATLARIGRLLVPDGATAPPVHFDRNYEIWTIGMHDSEMPVSGRA